MTSPTREQGTSISPRFSLLRLRRSGVGGGIVPDHGGRDFDAAPASVDIDEPTDFQTLATKGGSCRARR